MRAIIAALSLAGCSTLRCGIVDGVEVCAARPVCRNIQTGQFIKCPDWFVSCGGKP